MVKFDWTIIFQVVNFIVLLIILTKLLYKPLLKLLDDRKKKIEDDITEAENMRKEAGETLEKYRQSMAEAQQEAQNLKDDVHKNALSEANQILDEANKDAQTIVENAKKEIDQMVIQAKQELIKEIKEHSVALSAKLLKREINDQDHTQLIDSYIKEIGGLN